MKHAYLTGLLPLSALVALGLAACGARSDLLYGGDDLGPAGVPSFTGNLPPGGSSGGAAGSSSFGMVGAGARGGAAGSSSVAGRGSSEPPDPVPQSDCSRAGGVFTGAVLANDTDELRVLEGCTELRGSLTLFGDKPDYQVIRALRRVTDRLQLLARSSPLNGLEQITSVGELVLNGVSLPTLAPLANLQELNALSISGSSLTDLSGLANVPSLQELSISSSTLGSLRGLAVSGNVARVSIDDSSIGSLSGLERVEAMDSLIISQVSKLTSLEGLSGLRRVGSLSLEENPGLTNTDALSGLTSVDDLSLANNASLARLSDFPALTSLLTLMLYENPRLEVTPVFGSLKRIGLISITNNPALSRVSFPSLEEVGPAGASSNRGPLGSFEVIENGSLSDVSAPRLASTGTLFISRNPGLQRVAFPGLLTSRDALSVVLNRQLPPASLFELFDVQTSHLKLAGNQGEPDVLSPCPWPQDGVCDEGRICPYGTDGLDCGTF